MANNIAATLKHAGFFAGALGLLVASPLANQAKAADIIGFEYSAFDVSTSTTILAPTFATGVLPLSPANIVGAGFTISLTLNDNFPGTIVAGTMSTQATVNSTTPGILGTVRLQVQVWDQTTGLPAVFSLPSGTGFSLLGGSTFTTNGTLGAGTMTGKDFANATSVTSPALPVAGGFFSQATGLSSLAGYTLENDITLTGFDGAAGGGFSSITAQTSSSVEAVPTGSPEPASLAVLGVGLAGLRFVRRRRAKL